MQHTDRQDRLESATDSVVDFLAHVSLLLSLTKRSLAVTSSLSIKCLARKNRALSMSKKDAELNEFIDEVSDGAYNLPCKEVILKRVKQLSCRHDRANFLFSWKTA